MGEPVNLADIRRHRCVVGTMKGPPLTWVVFDQGIERRLSPPPTHQLSSGEAMVDAVVSGLGLGQFAISLVREHLDAGRLRAVLQPFASAGVGVHVVWPKRSQLSPQVRYVVDELLARASRSVLD